MNIGYLVNAPAEKALRTAANLGFDGIELGFRTGGPCDLEQWTADDTARARDAVEETGVKILSVASYWVDHLSPDQATRDRAAGIMARQLELAPQLGASVITCMAFGDPLVAPEDQVALFGQVFGEYARWAEDAGVRIGIENWPGVRKDGGLFIRNLAHSPAMFERLFEAVPSTAVGLEFDPSHLYWQGADPARAARDFAERLVIVHAKDTQVFKDRLHHVGIYGDGWWRYRLPGFGQVDWDALAGALAEVGFSGDVIIEHEDPVFSGERFNEGLAIGLKFLRQTLKQ